MAYLGPEGTYGEMAAQAFRSRYDADIELLACSSIAAIWKTAADFHVLPLENTIHGGVHETLDCLLSVLKPISTEPSQQESQGSVDEQESRRRRRLRMDLALPIRHCLVAPKGTKLEEIKYVRSHEQALGQSSIYLSEHLPHATQERYRSTAAAAISLLSPTEQEQERTPAAAICSKGVLRRYPDALDLLHEGTQSVDNNYTRFLLFDQPDSDDVPSPRQSTSTNLVTTDFYALTSAREISALLAKRVALNVASRPAPVSHLQASANGGKKGPGETDKFPTWYVVELERHQDDTEDPADIGRYLGRTTYRITEDELNAL
ncbi:hypothetical protein IAU60_005478 [Kwoniella sp. DSM 27419]